MIDGSAAGAHDAALVRVPGGGVDADRQRPGGLHVRRHRRLTLDDGVAAHGDDLLGGVHGAFAGDPLVAGVRVVALLLDAAGLLHVVVCVLRPAAVAA